jgi:hypothetical protein
MKPLEPLERYGITWTGPQSPITVPMMDGYWTPYHLANARIEQVEQQRDALQAEVERLDSDAQVACVIPLKQAILAYLEADDDLHVEVSRRSSFGCREDDARETVDRRRRELEALLVMRP